MTLCANQERLDRKLAPRYSRLLRVRGLDAALGSSAINLLKFFVTIRFDRFNTVKRCLTVVNWINSQYKTGAARTAPV